ncbi:MAG: NAD(P)/FAD-dependent oxidoreductase [Casimicrobiaceae bacterium]
MTFSRKDYDIAIVGAGPAGMASAATASALGLAAIVVDDQAAPGGQIYRGVSASPAATLEALGPDYRRGQDLVRALQRSGAEVVHDATVWNIDPAGTLAVTIAGKVHTLTAKRILVATGAQERPFPIPGWTLPGVMTAGAAQILLKESDLVPNGPTVIAGTGPLLWLLAAQMIRAGGRIDAILDTTPRTNWKEALPHARSFLMSSYFRRGLALMTYVRRRVRVIRGVRAMRAIGETRVTEVAYRTADGVEQRLPVDLLLLHQGVVPSLHLADTLGCQLAWDAALLQFRPVVDAWGATSVANVAVLGDGAGIAGAVAAAHRGHRGALDAAFRLGHIGEAERNARGRDAGDALASDARARRFVDLMYRPAQQFRVAEGDTIVCRCEEVPAARISELIADGVLGPNQMKFFVRCGMGPCQGRLCGLTVTEMFAAQRNVSPGDVGHYRLRTPIKPITVAEMASMPKGRHAEKAVVRL